MRDLAESVATCSPDRKVRQAVAAMVWWDICDVPFYKEDPYMPQFREFALKYDPVEHDDYDSWAVLAATMKISLSAHFPLSDSCIILFVNFIFSGSARSLAPMVVSI